MPKVIPVLEELYAGQHCYKLDEDLAYNLFLERTELKQMFGEIPEVKYNNEELFKPHILSEINLKFYNLNPDIIKYEVRIDKF